MTSEDQLRRLMRDPGWSLPAWPDAQARVRRAARRQRLTAASVCAVLAVIITTAAVVPVALMGRVSRGVTQGPVRNRVPKTVPSRPARQTIFPPVGTAGFPASIYPAATKPRAAAGALRLCPDPVGLEAPGPATPAAAIFVLQRLGQGLSSDLHLSDRSAWPLLVTIWQSGGFRLLAPTRTSVRYSGPLQPNGSVPAGLQQAIVADCGAGVARATWVIVYGPPNKPALDAVILFLTRRGHMLFYNTV